MPDDVDDEQLGEEEDSDLESEDLTVLQECLVMNVRYVRWELYRGVMVNFAVTFGMAYNGLMPVGHKQGLVDFCPVMFDVRGWGGRASHKTHILLEYAWYDPQHCVQIQQSLGCSDHHC